MLSDGEGNITVGVRASSSEDPARSETLSMCGKLFEREPGDPTPARATMERGPCRED